MTAIGNPTRIDCSASIINIISRAAGIAVGVPRNRRRIGAAHAGRHAGRYCGGRIFGQFGQSRDIVGIRIIGPDVHYILGIYRQAGNGERGRAVKVDIGQIGVARRGKRRVGGGNARCSGFVIYNVLVKVGVA